MRIVPGDGHRYHYARAFTGSFLELGGVGLEDAPVHIAPGDIFLALELDPRIAERGHDFLRYHAHRGLRVIIVVYGLLLARQTDWFPRKAPRFLRVGCDELRKLRIGLRASRRPRPTTS